ncbi:hypothetical protein F4802DRAFT_600484 [Xylaria palmicola]|nr:hypothetical protein F4802DRAFT_600484 [Xylaria palmicola]
MSVFQQPILFDHLPIDFWSIIGSEQVTIAKSFVEKIKVFLALECENLSFKAMFPPPEAEGVSLDDYINEGHDPKEIFLL